MICQVSHQPTTSQTYTCCAAQAVAPKVDATSVHQLKTVKHTACMLYLLCTVMVWSETHRECDRFAYNLYVMPYCTPWHVDVLLIAKSHAR